LGEEVLKKLLRNGADLIAKGTDDLPLQASNLRLRLGLPAGAKVKAKGRLDLEFRKLRELCDYLQASGVSGRILEVVREGLPEEALQAWFGFVSDALGAESTAADLLSKMRVKELGDATSLKEEAETILSKWYRAPALAKEAIRRVLHDSSPQSLLRYEHFAESLGPLQRVGTFPPWYSFAREGATWWRRSSVPQQETARRVWGNNGGGPELRFLASATQNDPLSPLLLRLALHAAQGVRVTCVSRDTWRDHALQLTGGTLGAGVGQRINEVFPASCDRLPSPPAQSTEGPDSIHEDLQGQMDEATWEGVLAEVDRLLDELANEGDPLQDLRAAWSVLLV
jgi:hypothetical protein